jgi:PAS domain S-box-containing protein
MDAGYSWLGILIDSSFASRFLVDRERKIIFANRAAQKLFGYADRELAGQPIDIIFASQIACEIAIPRMPLFAKRIVGDDGEISGRTKNGDELILRVGTAQIDTLRESYLSVTVFDITSYKQKERELVFRARQLEEVNNRVSKFAYLVANDLRTELVEILSVSSKLAVFLAEGRQKEAAQASEMVHDLASRACDVVGDLLEYSQEAASVLNLQFVDVRDEIELVLRDLSPAIAQANAIVQNNVPADLKVKADKPQFERLIASLLANSVNSDNANCVSEIIISAVPNANGIRLSVDATPSRASTAGNPQEGSLRSPNGGLKAVRSICEKLGWRVSAEELPERGARYKVDIGTSEPKN